MGPLLLGERSKVLREGTSHTLEWGSSPVRLWTPCPPPGRSPGPGRKASRDAPRVPSRALLGPHPGRHPLSPADGLLDWPLLQVDEVVQGGGALVIVHLCEEHPVQRGALPRPQPRAPAPGPRSVLRVPMQGPPPRRTRTVRARSPRTVFCSISCSRMSTPNFRQYWIYSWLPRACLLEGQRDKAVSILETQWNFQGKCTPQPRGQRNKRKGRRERAVYLCRALFPGCWERSQQNSERSRGVSKEKPPNTANPRSAQTLTWLGIYYRYHWFNSRGGNFWREEGTEISQG